ncbi:putative S-adenosyl-L-methionine-dependent methyltransferase [Blattamonas nauphoetae]|uniref:Cap-specific mRNA (nucleoside-2'-O-)-methyltransferase 1 n=1 Tax=Blattamonas nauphoetae TaxID=2049346 RepID=A0ABQ9X9Q1_9EUKA|nr:putative S-adenosyl-L-methionine-dependent methyltransferase [Blattamonas nauphoetae]
MSSRPLSTSSTRPIVESWTREEDPDNLYNVSNHHYSNPRYLAKLVPKVPQDYGQYRPRPRDQQQRRPPPERGKSNLFAQFGFSSQNDKPSHLGDVTDVINQQRGATDRRGLGYDQEDEQAKPEHEVILPDNFDITRSIRMTDIMSRLPTSSQKPPQEWKHDWIVISDTPPVIESDLFCDPKKVDRLFELKTAFDNVPSRDFVSARNKSNPYELIGKSIFQNRAALKMANVDSTCHFLKRCPIQRTVLPSHHRYVNLSQRPLVFADICAGPGGFTEYICWRTNGAAIGYGFTIKGENDFRLDKFNQRAPSHNFLPLYGPLNNGDITKEENLRDFQKYVLKDTADVGVDLVMADGGFSVEGQFNQQELIMRQLILCQFIMALSVLREGGSFMCKMFDIYTPFTVELVYLVSLYFTDVGILKPLTSRPANSERYLIAEGFKRSSAVGEGKQTDTASTSLLEHLYFTNKQINAHPDDGLGVVQVYPLELIPKAFIEALKQSNLDIADQQQTALEDVLRFIRDPNLVPFDQHVIQKECLQRWDVPNPSANRTYGENKPFQDGGRDSRDGRENYRRDGYRGRGGRDDRRRGSRGSRHHSNRSDSRSYGRGHDDRRHPSRTGSNAVPVAQVPVLPPLEGVAEKRLKTDEVFMDVDYSGSDFDIGDGDFEGGFSDDEGMGASFSPGHD